MKSLTHSFLLVMIFLLFVGACKTSIKKEQERKSENPLWITNIQKQVLSEEAVIDTKERRKYDPDIFKFKDEPAFVPVEQKEDPEFPDKALHVFINQGAAAAPAAPAAPAALDLSRIERIYHNLMGLSGGKGIRQVGYQELLSSAPDGETLALEEYIVGAGDTIDVKITGPLNFDKKLIVSSNGTIFLPERIGNIDVAGVKKSELKKVISKAVSKELINFKLDVTLLDLRKVRVLLTGNVKQPGLKKVIAGSTLIDVLSEAGGIHKDGSLRRISIKSKDGTEKVVDLYQLLFQGKQNQDPILKSGDQVIVPPIGNTVCLLGVTGQGIYEIIAESLNDLFEIHGKLNAFVSKDRVFFEKTEAQKERRIYSLDLDKAKTIKLADGFVFEFQGVRNELDNTVEITGAVSRPGKYPWHQGMKVSDLLKKGEGFLLDASLHKALIRRKLNGEVIYGDAAGLGVTRVREEIIWLPIDLVLAESKQHDIELKRFDSLRIMNITDFQDKPQVEVLGAVRKPGTYALTQNMTLGDLVQLAGNPSKAAYPGNGVIVRKVYNPEKKSFDVKMFHFDVREIIDNQRSSLVTLEDDDRVIVRVASSQSVKVSINGKVHFPGSYILPAGSKITDLIIAAGGILENADLRAAEFTRESIRKLQEKRLDDLFEKTRQRFDRSRSFITRDGRVRESYASTMELRGLEKLKDEMFRRQIRGRVVVDFLQDKFPESRDNLILDNMDSLTIPQKLNSIMVMGHVYSPNAYVWKEKMTVEDYLKMSGGYREEAGEKEVYVVFASGQVKSAKQIGHGSLMGIVPGPGDSILVPKEELERSGLAVTSDYLSILRQAAELGAISRAIPNAGDVSVGVNSDTTSKEIQGGSYTPLLSK